jgi:tetratricopeptide (TPR) repeat protein
MKYSTPRNDPPPPPSTESPPTSSHQDRWTPAPTPHVRRPHQLVLIWDGRTKADFEALYQEAQAQERLGIVEDAEKMFREALAGFENLLSATHEDTNAAAYRLALFYARNDRMKDADRVLDWVTRNHIESFGIEHQKTVDHLFNVVDMFHDWSRTEDAITFLSRIIDACQGLVHGTTGNSNGSKAPNTRTPPSQLLPLDRLMPTTEDSEPTVTDHQISIATARAKANDEMAEPILLRLIEQCERQPKHLARQILQCRSALLGLYSAQGGISMNEALDQAQEAFWKALDSQQEKTESFFEASTELAKWYARAGRHKTADDMFIRIQSDAVESFGADSRRTITILERIGLFYQKDGMWDEAEPWFEQALAACYTTLGENSGYTKNLEIALENQYYEIYRPSQEELESDLVRRHHY